MRQRPLHPLLLAALPIVSMYGLYPGQNDLGEIAASLATMLLAVAALWAVLLLIYRDARKSALLLSTALLLFLLVPEELFRFAERSVIGRTGLGRQRYLFAVIALGVAAWAVWLYRTRRALGSATAVANVAATGFLLIPVVALGTFWVKSWSPASRHGRLIPLPLSTRPAAGTPDIYYVIFDRYGDRETLADYGVDNAELYQYLRTRGFFIAQDSRSNYIKTSLSLSSSLNLNYHDDLTASHGRESTNWLPINFRLREHVVGRFLKARGYEYIHLGSWWWPTRANPNADVNINRYALLPHPVMLLFRQPLASPVTDAVNSALVDARLQQWERVRSQLESFRALPQRPRPKFVFAHILVPHPPAVFDPDGSFVSQDLENRRSPELNYRNQVMFANRMIVQLVDTILSASANPPVIILQGDEGPYPKGGRANLDSPRWRNLSAAQLRERSAILNAYHLPGVRAGVLYPSISPVNSFRVVFNTYHGTDLPLLPDRTYRHAAENRPYAYEDVTSVVQAASSERQQRRTVQMR
jgi:hypothetical protein